MKVHRVFLTHSKISVSSRIIQFHKGNVRDSGTVVIPFMRVVNQTTSSRYIMILRVKTAVNHGLISAACTAYIAQWQRAGIILYTSKTVLAQYCVFIKQSLSPNSLIQFNVLQYTTVYDMIIIPKLLTDFAEFLKHCSLFTLVYSTYPPESVYDTIL